jgi:ABC-type Fe3+-hydroxamate transport system substrate-binding protein
MPRIVSLIASATEIVDALGMTECLVGRSHECDYPEAVKTLPVCTRPRIPVDGSSREIDALVKESARTSVSIYDVFDDVIGRLEPTHIVTQIQCEVCAVSLRDVEAALSRGMKGQPRIVSLQPDSLAQIWEDFRRVARALEIPERGESVVAGLQARMARGAGDWPAGPPDPAAGAEPGGRLLRERSRDPGGEDWPVGRTAPTADADSGGLSRERPRDPGGADWPAGRTAPTVVADSGGLSRERPRDPGGEDWPVGRTAPTADADSGGPSRERPRDPGGPARRPRVACIEWIEPLMAAGNWTPELIEMAGGINLFGEAGRHSPWMTWEQLAGAEADVIVIAPCGFDLERTEREMYWLTGRPDWKSLRAVQSGRVYLADGNQYFNRPGPRVVETFEILAEILHPEIAPRHRGLAWRDMMSR